MAFSLSSPSGATEAQSAFATRMEDNLLVDMDLHDAPIGGSRPDKAIQLGAAEWGAQAAALSDSKDLAALFKKLSHTVLEIQKDDILFDMLKADQEDGPAKEILGSPQCR